MANFPFCHNDKRSPRNVNYFIYFKRTELIYLLTGVYIVHSFWSGTIALSLIFESYISQSIRGALKAVSIGQKCSFIIKFKNPQSSLLFYHVIRHAIPGLTNQWLALLKDTALVSLIGVTELLKQSQLIATVTQNVNWYAIVAVIYLFISFISKCLINKIEKNIVFKDLDMSFIYDLSAFFQMLSELITSIELTFISIFVGFVLAIIITIVIIKKHPYLKIYLMDLLLYLRVPLFWYKFS